MCGLVGIAGDLAYKDEATMKRLFLLDYFRGPDSTGLARVKNAGEVEIAKLASNPLDLFEMDRFKKVLTGLGSRLFLGHNRLATRGEKNTFNAHPFQYDHIVGAHNGTLDSASTKRLEDAVGETFSVDSQALFAAIAKLGIEAAIELCTEGKTQDTGAWSLAWYDQNEGTFNLLRNKHRPMWYGFDKEFKRLFFASQWEIINAAVQMSGQYELYIEGKEKFKFFSTKEDVHMKFDLDALAKGGDKRPKPKAKVIKGREPVQAAGHTPFVWPEQTTGTGFHTPRGQTTHSTTQSHTAHTHRNRDRTNSILHLVGDLGRPLAGFITHEKFNDIAKYGCCWCGDDVLITDKGITIYDRDDAVFCAVCSGNAHKDDPANRIWVHGATMDSMAGVN